MSENTNTKLATWTMADKYRYDADPLLECLYFLLRLENKSFTRETLVAGLPLVENKLTPELFIRAAERASLASSIVKRKLADISNLVLPVVLLLKNKQVLILLDKKNSKKVKVVDAGSESGSFFVDLEALEEEYTGFAIFIKPSFSFDERAKHKFTETDNWFWPVIKSSVKIYGEVILASLCINIFAVISPMFAMNVYDRVVPNNAIDTLYVLSFGIIIAYTFDLIMKMLRGYFIDAAAKKADVVMSAKIFAKMMGIKMSNRPESVGGFASSIHQFESFRDFFTSATMTAVIDVPFIFLFIGMVYYIGGSIALIPVFIVPIVILIGWTLQKPLNALVKESYKYASQKQSMLIEFLTGVETIKTLMAEGIVQRKWEHALAMSAKISGDMKNLSAAVVNLTGYVQSLANVIVIMYGVNKIANGQLTTGGLIACTILTGRALSPLSQVASLLTRYHQAQTSLKGIDTMMQMETERMPNKSPLYRPHLNGSISFSNVIFAYPKQKVPALNEVSFNIAAGEKVGIIGKIGSGKTTIEKLVLGLYYAQKGSVLIDGTEIQQLDLHNVRKNIGYVPQDIVLFYGSVKDNIIFGAPYVDDETILNVAKLSGVMDFVARHPEGFDMQVGERGEKLSGGQRQAIALARAILFNPNILLLDEPTNMMDSHTEESLRLKLREYAQNKTMILITHKGNMLSLVDRLIFIEHGQIKLDGPRDHVLRTLAEARAQAEQV